MQRERTAGRTDDTPLDEMVDGGGRTRPHWRGIVERAFTLGADALRERARLLARAASEEGAAGLLAGSDTQAWRCDPIPIPLPAAEFAALATGLAQRAAIIEQVLRDLYGPQTLLERGLLPPSFVYRGNGFLRAGHMPDDSRRRLHLYAADLVRGPDGAWRVIADRCARPGGMAAALEHRRLLARVMPELFRQDVESLDPFFETWRETLRASHQAPGIALLTEGHRDPAWFEHVLLARELGVDLVQGGDLTLRGGTLKLKTLRGLKPIGTLINRQHVPLLDPLELDWHDTAGIPGLLSAWRGNRVVILNDPGAGFAEQPGLAAFLPRIAAFLGEPLQLNAAVVHWLGDAAIRARVTADLDRWLFRPAHDATVAPVAAATLSPHARRRLAAEIDRAPELFVAAEGLVGSVAPTVEPASLDARSVILRLFLLHDGERWVPMRGGLARIAPASRAGSALPREGIAKDVFILADRETIRPLAWSQPILPLSAQPPLAIRRTEGDLPARVAEEFFQLGRRLEVFETGARLVRALAIRLSGFVHRPRELVELRILAACLAPLRLVSPDLLIDPSAPGLTNALIRLAHTGSPLAEQARALFGRINQLRDRLTAEMHFILTQQLGDVLGAFAGLDPGHAPPSLDDLAHVTGRMLGFAATLAGLVAETMVRGGGRLFLELGMRLTRAETVATELRACLGAAATLPGQSTPDLDAGLTLALELRDSAITYRSRYLGRLEPAPVLDLVLADPANPRALGTQLDAVCNLLVRLGEVGGTELLDAAERLMSANQASLEQDIETLPEHLARLETDSSPPRRAIAPRYSDLLPEMQTLQ